MEPPLIIIHQEIPKGSQPDNTEGISHISIVGLLWQEEIKRFQVATCYTIHPDDSLNDWIKRCEEESLTDHLFYHLMVQMLDYLTKQP